MKLSELIQAYSLRPTNVFSRWDELQREALKLEKALDLASQFAAAGDMCPIDYDEPRPPEGRFSIEHCDEHCDEDYARRYPLCWRDWFVAKAEDELA